MNTLTSPLHTFQRLLHALAEDRHRTAFARVGVHHAESSREWLVRDFVLSPRDPLAVHHEPIFHIAITSNPLSIPLTHLPREMVGSLYLGDGPWRGYLWGVVRIDDTIEPLHRLFLTGSGMHSIPILNPHAHEPNLNLNHQLTDSLQTRWSRTIGALGGEATWQRLVRLHIAIIGCGRTGSLVAVTLARLGVRHLTLIDPDIVETHNLGEMDAANDTDLGRPKAEAVADHLRALLPHSSMSLFPIVASIGHPVALAAVRACNVLFCCADNDAARLATAIPAALYYKVLVDIGTGIFYSAATTSHLPAPRTMGADIRLILPGDGCLLCRGNLTDYARAVDDLCNHRPPRDLQRNWSQQRAGSLRTLNQLAAALGVQMLQDMVAERLQASTWARIEFNRAGHLTVHYPPMQHINSRNCALCAKAGLGDEALRWTGQSCDPTEAQCLFRKV